MITKQDSAKYPALFDEASKALGLSKDQSINSLHDYFVALKALAETDLKYTILPLNEKPFFINANTREIEPSESFPKNVVGVQGDQVAEIVYFKIDRYFDAMDLNTQRIYIQWENAGKEQGLSCEYIRDITSEPNYIIFGWPLTKEITAYPGTIKYSIRFYGLDEEDGNKTIMYSFSTEPASLIIKPSMDFNVVNPHEHYHVAGNEIVEMIKKRFGKFPTITDDDKLTYEVEAPIMFYTNYTLPETGSHIFDISDDTDNNNNAESYTIRVSATAPTSLKYKTLVKSSESEEFKVDDAMTKAMFDDYILTEDVKKDQNKTYYQNITTVNGEKTGTIYEGDDLPNDINIYEKYRCVDVTKSGMYRIEAIASMGISTASTYSSIANFPAPVAPPISTAQRNIILQDNTADLTVGYEEDNPEKNVPRYTWQKRSPSAEEAWEVINDAHDRTYTVNTTDQEGLYRAQIVNWRNGDASNPVYVQYRVTQPAQVPEILEQPSSTQFGAVGLPIHLTINTDGVYYDSLQVQWLKEEENEFKPCTENLINISKDGKTQYTPQETGVYKAQIILTYNTQVKEVLSNEWAVV